MNCTVTSFQKTGGARHPLGPMVTTPMRFDLRVYNQWLHDRSINDNILREAENSFPEFNFEPYNSGSFSPSFTTRKVKLIDPLYRKHRIFIEPSFPARGLHGFTILIVRTEHSRISIGVAIQQGDEQRPDFTQYWRLDCETGEVCVRDAPPVDLSQNEDSVLQRFDPGSVVGVLLDMDHQTVEFAVNGTRVGREIKLDLRQGEPIEKLRAACSLVEEGDMLEIVDIKLSY